MTAPPTVPPGELSKDPPGAEATGLTHRTLIGFFWMCLGSGSQAALQLLVLLVLARLVSPEDFGIISAAQVVVAFSSIFSQLGVGPAVVQRGSLEERHLRAGSTLSSLFGAGMALGVFLLAPAIGSLFRMEGLAPVVRVMSVVFLVQGQGVVAESLLQREMRFRRLAAVEVVALAVGYGGVGISLAILGYGVWALVAAQVTQVTLKSLCFIIVRPHPRRPCLERRALAELMYFGGGFTMARIGNYAASQIDNFVVGRWLGAEALGIYGRAYQLMAAPAFLLGQILDRVLFPAMAIAQNSPDRLSTAYRRGVALIALLILPVSSLLFVLAPEVVRIVLGPAWSDAVVPFRIFAAGMLFRSSYKMSDALARATGAVYRRAWRQVIFAGLVGAGAWLGQGGGIAGVAIGVLLAIAINFALMAHLSLLVSGLRWSDFAAAHRGPLLMAGLLGGAAWLSALGLRGIPAPTLLIAAGVATVAGLLGLLILRYRPSLVGEDGLWMMSTLQQTLPARFDPFRRFGLGAR